MIRHVVLLTWNENCPEAAVEAVTRGLAALPKQIPEIRSYRFGRDLGLGRKNADYVLVADFDSPRGLRELRSPSGTRRSLEESHRSHTRLIRLRAIRNPLITAQGGADERTSTAAKLLGEEIYEGPAPWVRGSCLVERPHRSAFRGGAPVSRAEAYAGFQPRLLRGSGTMEAARYPFRPSLRPGEPPRCCLRTCLERRFRAPRRSSRNTSGSCLGWCER